MPNTNERSFLGYGYQKSSTGDLLLLGKKKKDKNVTATTSLSAPAAIGGGSNLFEQDATALQSDAMSGQIYGGTSAEREEAAGLAGDMGESKGGGKGKGLNIDANAAVGAGIGLGSALISELDDDPGYGGMDVAGESLKYASMGASLGPVGAGVGAVVGGAVGLFKKKKFEKAEREAAIRARGERSAKTSIALSGSEAEEFYGKTKQANQGLYGAQDIDNFITQNRA
jgi:hypothetical protein